MSAEGYAHGVFRESPAIGGRRVEVVYPVGEGVVHLPVYHFLVDFVLAISRAGVGDGRQTHATVPEQRNFVARCRVDAIGHFTRLLVCHVAVGGVIPRTATV